MANTAFSKDNSSALKGIAIILMVCHHLFRVPSLYSTYTINFAPLAESQVNHICTYFKICVGIFAFISGYGLTAKYQSEKGNLSRLCFKQYLKSIQAFWPVYAISLIAGQLIDGHTAEVYFTGNILQNALNVLLGAFGLSRLFGTPMLVGEWWYLSAMVVFIFITPIMRYSVQKFGWLMPVFFLVAFPRVLGIEFQGGTQPFSFLMPVLLGVIFKEYNIFERLSELRLLNGKKRNEALKSFIYLTLLAVSYKMYHALPIEAYYEVHYGVIPVIFIICANDLLHYPPQFARKILSFLGKHSGNIYFIHTVIRRYLLRIIYSMPWFVLSAAFLFAVCLGFSVLLESAKKRLRSR